MNFFELTDEQLEDVVGGTAINSSTQVNSAFAPTNNTAVFASNVNQNGSTIIQSNTNYQAAFDVHKFFIR